SYDVQEISGRVMHYSASGQLTAIDSTTSVPWNPAESAHEHQDWHPDGTMSETLTWTDSAGQHTAVYPGPGDTWTETTTAPDGTTTVDTHTSLPGASTYLSQERTTLPDGTTITTHYDATGALTGVTSTATGPETWTDQTGQHTLTPNG